MNTKALSLSGILAAGLMLAGAGTPASAQAATPAPPHWVYPVIKGYGPVQPLPHAAEQPSKDKVYKVVFDVTSGAKDHAKVAPGLDHVARAVNVFASAGVPVSHMKFVAVVHGPATASVLDNAQYHKQFGVDNPNIKLIAALRKAGVKVQVCGQALADNRIAHAWVNPDVTITLSALADLAIYGNAGYAYEKQ